MEKLEEILSDVEKEGDLPFENTPEETPSESAAENNTGEEKEEENIPFHKHPRWIERENELNELRERDEANAREIAELRAMTEAKETNNAKIPDWFVELYGENEVAWQKYSEHENKRTEEIEARILARREAEEREATQEAEKWSKWVDSQMNTLEEDGHTFDRNKFAKIMLEYSPTDENNNLDFQKGFKIYQALEGKTDTAKSEARKILADKTTSDAKGEPTQKDYLTSNELRNRSWSSL